MKDKYESKPIAEPHEDDNQDGQQQADELSRLGYLDYKGKIKYRKYFVVWTIIISSVWSMFVFYIVIALGKGWIELSPSVAIAVISTAFVEVLGLPAIVIRGLFNKKK